MKNWKRITYKLIEWENRMMNRILIDLKNWGKQKEYDRWDKKKANSRVVEFECISNYIKFK